MRIDRLKREFSIRVHWRAFPLHPETPPEGRTLEALFAGRSVDIPAMLARLRQVATELNLPWGERTMTFNSRLEKELGKWAEDRGRGEAFHHAAFLAYFQRGRNIARRDVLLEICSQAGLDPQAAEAALDRRTYREAVDSDWQLSHRLGIRAVPTFIAGDQQLVGAQSYSALETLLLGAGVDRRQ